MNNGMILIAMFVIPIGIAIVFYYLMRRRKKRRSETIKSDWNNFQKAITNNHIKKVSELGTKLIWNEHLTSEKLKEMSAFIKSLGKDYAELKELKTLIYNKHLDWNKKYPHSI